MIKKIIYWIKTFKKKKKVRIDFYRHVILII
jgi:hypothetical protein